MDREENRYRCTFDIVGGRTMMGKCCMFSTLRGAQAAANKAARVNREITAVCIEDLYYPRDPYIWKDYRTDDGKLALSEWYQACYRRE